MADGPWTYAAARAKREAVRSAVSAAVSAALLTGGLVIELWWDRGTHHKHMSGIWLFVFGALALIAGQVWWRNWRFFHKLDQAAAKSSVGVPQ